MSGEATGAVTLELYNAIITIRKDKGYSSNERRF